MNNLLEVIKENKSAIIKKALIIGGAIAGLALVYKMTQPGEEVLLPEIAEESVETPIEENSEV